MWMISPAPKFGGPACPAEGERRAGGSLPREVSGASDLTAGLADALIDRVYVSPGNQVEIVWKMKDFCGEGSE